MSAAGDDQLFGAIEKTDSMNRVLKAGLRGALIVFEGCDRSGKSTQCAKLAEKLISEGRNVQLIKFPNRTTRTGQLINEYLQQKEDLSDQTTHLLFSANRWEAFDEMKGLLQSGTTLIVDRYAYSGVAFTAAKGLDLEWCKQPDVGLIKPDAVIFMTLSSEQAAQRGQFGEERYEKQEFQERVSKVFQKLYNPSYWQAVNADSSVDAILSEVYKIATEVIKQSADKPLEKLWIDGNIWVNGHTH